METAYLKQAGFGVRLLEQHGDGVYGEELPVFVDPEGTNWIGARSGQKYGIEFIVPTNGSRFLSV